MLNNAFYMMFKNRHATMTRHYVKRCHWSTGRLIILTQKHDNRVLASKQKTPTFIYLWNDYEGAWDPDSAPEPGVFSDMSLPLGVNLAPGVELWSLVGMFTPRADHSQLFRKMEGRTEGICP
jgi:hypothetical protein